MKYKIINRGERLSCQNGCKRKNCPGPGLCKCHYCLIAKQFVEQIKSGVDMGRGLLENNNYVDNPCKHPLLKPLSVQYPKEVNLIKEMTKSSTGKRANSKYRQEFVDKVVKLLPNVKEITAKNPTFLFRISKDSEPNFFHSLNHNDYFPISNQFLSFYLNGIRGGGMFGNGDNIIFTEDLDDAKFLGGLSLTPGEDETIITSEYAYFVYDKFPNMKIFIQQKEKELKPETVQYFKRIMNKLYLDKQLIWIKKK